MTLPGMFILLPLFMASDLARDVRDNCPRHVEFRCYQTYSLLTSTDTPQLGLLAAQRLRAALGMEAGRRGLVKRVTGYTSGPTIGQPITLQENLETAVTTPLDNYPPSVTTHSSG